MKSAIIAGCGDLGSALGQLLAKQGAKVWGLRRSPGHAVQGIEIIRADLTNAADLNHLPNVTDIVFCPAPDQRDEKGYRDTYVDSLRHLMTALPAGPGRRLIFVSSTAVYGQENGEWVDEDSPCQPRGFRGRILLEAEALAAEFSGTTLRLAGVYGPGRHQLIKRVEAGGPVQRTPDYWTNRIHRDDAARLLAHLLHLNNLQSIYHGVDNRPATLWEVCNWLSSRLGAPSPAAVEGSSSNKRISNERVKQTGFRFEYPDYQSGYENVIEQMQVSPNG